MNTKNLQIAAAELLLDFVSPHDLPAVATRAMEVGCDSPSLRQLAGLTRDRLDEARPLFDKARAELGLSPLSVIEAVLLLARRTAAEILDGSVTPEKGAAFIARATLWIEDEIPIELHDFIYADSEWDDRPEDRKELEAGIFEAAWELVG